LVFVGPSEQDESDRIHDSGFSDSDVPYVGNADVELDEGLSADATLASTITVLDEANRPLPGASIRFAGRASDRQHVQHDSGVQQLILRADAEGICRLHGLQPGNRSVHLEWDTRQADVQLTAGEDVKVTLPPPR